ncbi:cytochrome P450 [Hesseltinella vesiculosa]|uniref:Cytochrome P450 n=1 Tax=Hesseltinella vesiculosa TaxID=101127 RepID=A0A1X2GSP6_9FUNG|nr:cytochrome P450 [Hesseltinella vesiculosa]
MDQLESFARSTEGVIGITVAVALAAGVIYHRANKIDYGVPQVPTSGFFGSSSEYRRDPHAFTAKWGKKLGPVYGAKIFGQHATIVSGPAVREVFQNDGFCIHSGLERTFNMNLLTNNIPVDILPYSFIANTIRQYISANLDKYTLRLVEHVEFGFSEIYGQVSDEGITLPGVFPLVQQAIARANASVFVGVELAKNEQLIDSFKNMVLQMGAEFKPIPWLEPFPTVMHIRSYLFGKTSSVVRRHRAQLADALRPEVYRRLEAMKSNDSNWERPNDALQDVLENSLPPANIDLINYLVSWVTILVFSSMFTTAETAAVAIYRLVQFPEMAEELYQEQVEVLEAAGFDASAGPEVFTEDMVKKLVKLESVIRETGRAGPRCVRLPHTNITNETIVLSCGACIPPGENCFINVYANHNDPDLQRSIDDLSEFKPFRFVGLETNSAVMASDSFLVFGLGKHSCPGRWYAVHQMKIMLSILLHKFKLSSPDKITFVNKERMPLPLSPCRIQLTPRKGD